ncbi:aldehyde dehydrogenase family protein [Nonomuraea sp. SMC257]|uniref:Aldehyde dehydrogenase family protein n=1 Tax=Nonomuraea montanisoli TaxID=2741721 RepID=A0A7Y6IGJ9_9ACTN|nr:aldehyde dehydrogenase family protein [Nonomuraea montanisoli]NUW37165.1 aldehyde dehydrogenase family protein [Nonomuraea montanisoli]
MVGHSPQSNRERLRAEVLPNIDLRPFIDGAFVEPKSHRTLSVLEPATENTLAEMPCVDTDDVDAAVTAARHAFDSGPWPRMTPQERGVVLRRLAELIDRDAEKLALLESADTGKLLKGVRGWDVPHAATVYRYYADLAEGLVDRTLPSVGEVRVWTRREPIGVCAAILPWNFPFPCMSWKLAPALAAGCTVVVKSAERAPLSAQYLAGLVAEAGFPPGVVNILMGEGPVAGGALVADPRIDMVTFTGSVATGQQIARRAANGVARTTLELGGKSPNVIFADADLDSAVAGTIDGMFSVQGQNCCAASRTFVERPIFNEFLERLGAAALARRLGDPMDEATEQGPQIDRAHLERIDGYVQRALAAGAKAAVGGRPSKIGALWYEPTIITGAVPSMEISREEVFGPVGCVYPFDGFDEGVGAANDTEYGLSASVWTGDRKVADRFAAVVRAGTCWINCFGYFMEYAPWGGVKKSGLGRELGAEGLEEFLVTKTLYSTFGEP